MGRDAIYPGSTLGIIGINRNGAALIATAKKAGFKNKKKKFAKKIGLQVVKEIMDINNIHKDEIEPLDIN